MQYKPSKPVNPAANFIAPSSIFNLVQRLQGGARRQSLRSGSLGSGRVNASSTGDPEDFQTFLNVFKRKADNALVE